MSIFWDINEPLSYNCLFNFIVGARGVGKTYGTLKYCIEQYLKHKKNGEIWQFFYIRRYDTELEKLTKARGGRLFNAVEKEFPTHKFKVESNVLYIDDEICGYAQAVSTGRKLKSDAFPDVKFVIFDEFIIAKGSTDRYLSDEITAFLELYETIARLRFVPVFFLSNALSIGNPYFDYFRLNSPTNKKGIKRFGNSKDILVQNVKAEEYTSVKQKTRFGKLMEGTAYADYAFKNEWLLDNSDFIEKKPQSCSYYCTLIYNEQYMGIWYDKKTGILYVSFDYDENYIIVLSASTRDHKPNTQLFKQRNPFVKNIVECYTNGFVRYENQKLKNWFIEVMRIRTL